MAEPARYTLGHEPSTLASHGVRTAESSAAYLLPHLRAGMRLLDVGCGPGTVTVGLAEVVAPGEVVGIENVEAPLVAARAAGAQRPDLPVRFEVADAVSLPYADGSFDVVHAHQVLQHLTEPVTALREMARVCRPGGLVAVRDADYAAMAWHPELPALDEWRRVYRTAALANGAQPDAARRLRAWAAAAGLADVDLTTSTWTYADPAACRWWGHSQADRFGGEVFARQAAEQGVPHDAVAGIAEGWRTWGEHPEAWFVIVHGELLARV